MGETGYHLPEGFRGNSLAGVARDDHVELKLADVLSDMGSGVASEVDKVLADANS